LASNVGPLERGIIRTSNSKAKAPYTILLVGETGVGKPSSLELTASVLISKRIDHYDCCDYADAVVLARWRLEFGHCRFCWSEVDGRRQGMAERAPSRDGAGLYSSVE